MPQYAPKPAWFKEANAALDLSKDVGPAELREIIQTKALVSIAESLDELRREGVTTYADER